MKCRSLGTLSFLICLMGIAAISAAHGLLNGGFEDGGHSWSLRRGWTLDCSDSHTGRCSARYRTDRSQFTPIARQKFDMEHAGFCQLTVWIRTDLQDPPFWSDGEPTRTGISVQLWNHTGKGSLVPLDLAKQTVSRKGYRGQGGETRWTKYVGRTSMAAGEWEVRLYRHPVRSHVDGRLRKIANAKGTAWVDDMKLSPVK